MNRTFTDVLQKSGVIDKGLQCFPKRLSRSGADKQTRDIWLNDVSWTRRIESDWSQPASHPFHQRLSKTFPNGGKCQYLTLVENLGKVFTDVGWDDCKKIMRGQTPPTDNSIPVDSSSRENNLDRIAFQQSRKCLAKDTDSFAL